MDKVFYVCLFSSVVKMMGYSWNGLIMFHLNVMKHVLTSALLLNEKIDLGWVFLGKPNFRMTRTIT
jgi:hypothetical protein